MTVKEMRDKDDAALQHELQDKQKHLFTLRSQAVTEKLEDPSQFSMAWTTFEDAFRKGYPHIAEYTVAITDPAEATRLFWPTLRSSALPYNLFVLHKLDAASATHAPPTATKG